MKREAVVVACVLLCGACGKKDSGAAGDPAGSAAAAVSPAGSASAGTDDGERRKHEHEGDHEHHHEDKPAQ